jgi:hypothetical protein
MHWLGKRTFDFWILLHSTKRNILRGTVVILNPCRESLQIPLQNYAGTYTYAYVRYVRFNIYLCRYIWRLCFRSKTLLTENYRNWKLQLQIMFSEVKFYVLFAGAIHTKSNNFQESTKHEKMISQLPVFCISQETFLFYRKTNCTTRKSVKFDFRKHMCSCNSFSF